jgi:hypothetical protein
MKRNLGILSIVAMSLVFGAVSASAQSFAKAQVPFAFKVGKTSLPAGCYTAGVASESNTVVIRNCDTGKTMVSLARMENPRQTSPKLVFHRVSGQYFLAQIWSVAGTRGLTLPTSALERELELAAVPRTPEKIEIALR